MNFFHQKHETQHILPETDLCLKINPVQLAILSFSGVLKHFCWKLTKKTLISFQKGTSQIVAKIYPGRNFFPQMGMKWIYLKNRIKPPLYGKKWLSLK